MSIRVDPFEIASSFMKVHEAWMQNGIGLAGIFSKLAAEVQPASVDEISAFSENWEAGGPQNDPEEVFMGLLKSYAKVLQKVHFAYGNWLKDHIYEAPGVCEKDNSRPIFPLDQLFSAFSPYNFFWTNSITVRKLKRTEGDGAIDGYAYWLGLIQQGDYLIKIFKTFETGENIDGTTENGKAAS